VLSVVFFPGLAVALKKRDSRAPAASAEQEVRDRRGP
jgi:hypothetical protein